MPLEATVSMTNSVIIPLPVGQPPAPSVSGRPIRRRFAVDGRVRSGCLTCKARKKKCDGPAPGLDGHCRSCIRLGLVCEQPPLRRVTPPRPRKRAGRENDTVSSQPPNDESESASPKAVSPTDDPNGAAKVTEVLVSRRTCNLACPGSQDGMERTLLRYFLDHVAPLCSILKGDASRFCSVLLPMAIVDPPLLQALFAYASAHLDAAASVAPGMSEARLGFENQVARGIAGAITTNAVTETTVACALIISTAEVIGGDTSRWLLHLQGASHLVNHLGTSKLLQTNDGAFLLRYFAYHDIMASLTIGRRPLADAVYWVQGLDATVTSTDPFVGLAHHIFKHLPNICVLVAETADLNSSSCSDRRSRETLRAEDMAQALRSQDLHLQVNATDSYITALVHHAEAFRFAILFYLYRHTLHFCDAVGVYRLRMEDCGRQILQHVSQIPSIASCEIGLLFPLFMAGIWSSGDASTTQYIKDRLTCIETWTKFKHVQRVRELLEMLWEKGRTDWEIMLRELNWSISLA